MQNHQAILTTDRSYDINRGAWATERGCYNSIGHKFLRKNSCPSIKAILNRSQQDFHGDYWSLQKGEVILGQRDRWAPKADKNEGQTEKSITGLRGVK